MTVLVVLAWALVGLRLVLLTRQVAHRGDGPVSAVRPHVDPCLGPATGLPPRPPPAPESALQARLIHGVISREHYRAEMARLAAEDELRHPLCPPPA
jgi:hypothetical protein